METKRNLKYFIAPPISVITIIGLVVTVAALIVAFATDYLIPGILGVIVGLFIVAGSSGGKANDTDIEYQARELTKNLGEANMKKFEVYEKNFLRMLKPVDLFGYDFEAKESEFYFKKGQDGTPRTNYFVGANIIFTGEKVYVYKKRLSLTDEENNHDEAISVKYNELDRAEIEEKTFKTPKGDITYYVFRIFMKDGSKLLEMCIDYGADSDKAVDNINRAIATRTVELEKKAEEKAKKLAEFRARVLAGEVINGDGDMLF